MKPAIVALAFVCAVGRSDAPGEALLSVARINAHSAELAKVENILDAAGFRRGTYQEVSDPTAHFEGFEEWIYFVQPIFNDARNELLIGFDERGELKLSASQALSPMCDCPGDELYAKKAAEMDRALERIGQAFREVGQP